MRVFDQLRMLLRDELGTPRRRKRSPPTSGCCTRRGAGAALRCVTGAEAQDDSARRPSCAPAPPATMIGRGRRARRARTAGLRARSRADSGDDRGERVLLLTGDPGVGQDQAAGRDRQRGRTPAAPGARRPRPRGDAGAVPAVPGGAAATTSPARRSLSCGHRARARGRAARACSRELRRRLPELPPTETANPRPSATACSRRWWGCWGSCRLGAGADRARRSALGRPADAAAAASPRPCAASRRGLSMLRRLPLQRALERGVRGRAGRACATTV